MINQLSFVELQLTKLTTLENCQGELVLEQACQTRKETSVSQINLINVHILF